MASIKQIYPGLTFNHDGATEIGLVLNEEHMSNLSDTLILAGSILLTEGYKNEGDILSDMGPGSLITPLGKVNSQSMRLLMRSLNHSSIYSPVMRQTSASYLSPQTRISLRM